MRFLDTNFLLRYFTNDDEEKARAVLELLKRVEKNKEKIITSPLVMFETIFTLQSYYGLSREEIRDLLLPVINLRGLKLDLKDVFEKALEAYPKMKASFADIFNYYFMLKHGTSEIYSFDEDFDKMEGIKRIAP
ncbi:MAG TPA: type II toxin-antitoxin system VapC family toxin [Candidatus Atribacteria bacterium]|nr:type II toxin-antitoxin system VapC family toxin [Candidatus Atribacteria bacterium]